MSYQQQLSYVLVVSIYLFFKMLTMQTRFSDARHACIERFRPHAAHTPDAFINTVTVILLTKEPSY